jgi:tyrosine-protein kinase Etk/Wzc
MNTDSNNLSKPASENQGDDIDVLAMMLSVLRGWKTILFFTAIGLLVGLLYSRYENTTYSSDALIQIESSGGGVSS